jgi:response regulator of citrate/malate metabolism
MKKHRMRTVLVVGDDAPVQRALGELVAQAVAEAGRGQTMVVTASNDGEVLRALSRGAIDLVVANYREEGRGIELLGWLREGRFPARTLLLTCAGPWGESEYWRAKGVDAAVKRPATIEDIKTLIEEWFP